MLNKWLYNKKKILFPTRSTVKKSGPRWWCVKGIVLLMSVCLPSVKISEDGQLWGADALSVCILTELRQIDRQRMPYLGSGCLICLNRHTAVRFTVLHWEVCPPQRLSAGRRRHLASLYFRPVYITVFR